MSVLTDIVADIHGTLNDASVKALLGRKALTKHEQTRRVVWIRGTGSRVSRPVDVGGKLVTNNDATQDRHAPIYTMQESVEAHIYAEDEDACEQLFSNLLAAMKTALGSAWEPGRYEWQTETGSDGVNTGYAVRGCKIQFDSTWMIPSTGEIKPLTILTDQTHVCKIESPDGSTSELE